MIFRRYQHLEAKYTVTCVQMTKYGIDIQILPFGTKLTTMDFFLFMQIFVFSITNKTFIEQWVSYKKQEMLTLCEFTPSFFGVVRVAHLFIFLCFVCLCSVLCTQCCLCLFEFTLSFKEQGSCCSFCPIMSLYFLVPCCDMRYDFRIKMMFVSSLSSCFQEDFSMKRGIKLL